MADAADGRAHGTCSDFPEMTEYAGVNLGLQVIIMGKQKGLHLLNQKVWKAEDKWNQNEIGNDISAQRH